MEKLTQKVIKITPNYLMVFKNDIYTCCRVDENGTRNELKQYKDYMEAFKFIRLQEKVINH